MGPNTRPSSAELAQENVLIFDEANSEMFWLDNDSCHVIRQEVQIPENLFSYFTVQIKSRQHLNHVFNVIVL